MASVVWWVSLCVVLAPVVLVAAALVVDIASLATGDRTLTVTWTLRYWACEYPVLVWMCGYGVGMAVMHVLGQ